jgi:tetratricopeptide (TPR) repeat protein
VLSDRAVNATLKLMNRPPTEPLTEAVTREICLRTNSTAFLVGSIASLGSEYVIGLDAVNCQTGERLSRQQVQSPRQEDVLSTLSKATTRLRETIGESLSTIQKYDTPISEATTSSLGALQAYSLGNKANEASGSNAAIPILLRAIELDPNFALAHSFLGIVYANIQELGLAGEHFRKAYELRGRVSERENLRISAYYYSYVTGEVEKGNQTYELWARAYPRDYIPRNNLGRNYQSMGRYEEALPEMLEAVRLDPDNSVPYSNLVEIYCRLNRLGEARATYQRALALNLDRPGLRYNMYGVAFLEADTAETGRLAAWAAGKPGLEDFLLSYQSDTEAYSGRLGAARELSRRAIESALAAGQKETAAIRQLNAALREAEFGNVAEARNLAASALSHASTQNTQTLAALALARAGDSVRARELADGLEKENPLNTRINGYWLPSIRASIEINQQNPRKAIEILQAAARYELGVANPQTQVGGMLYPVYVRAQAYLLLRQGSAAAAEYQKYLDRRTIAVNCPLGALSHLGLARAYVTMGDSVKAKAAYLEFLTRWKYADPDIPMFREAKAEYEKGK